MDRDIAVDSGSHCKSHLIVPLERGVWFVILSIAVAALLMFEVFTMRALIDGYSYPWS